MLTRGGAGCLAGRSDLAYGNARESKTGIVLCRASELNKPMRSFRYHREVEVSQSLPEVFGFFAEAENLERITPPWLKFRMLNPRPVEMKEGATIAYLLWVHGVPIRWLTRIECWDPPFSFVDVQIRGPYRLWRHTHRFSSKGERTVVADTVELALPFGVIGDLVYQVQVARDIRKIFDFREQQIQERCKRK